MMKTINGGVHAEHPIDIQEFMIMPVSAETVAEAIRIGWEIFHALRKQLKEAGHNTNVGDEGGFAPNLASADAALGFITKAIESAGYRPGDDVFLALDPAATEFNKNGKYVLSGEGKTLDAEGMARYLADLAVPYPIVSIEDGMAEDDWVGWAALTREIGHRVQLLADDLFVTNPNHLAEGTEKRDPNSILLTLHPP